MSATDFLYKVDVKLALNGRQYPVSFVQIILTHNGVPEVLCHFDPFATTADAARALSVGEFATTVARMRALEYGRGKGTVAISVTPEGQQPTLGVTSVTLRDWPVHKVAFGELSRNGSMSVSVRLAHPASKLMADAMYLSGMVGEARQEVITGAANILDAVILSMERYVALVCEDMELSRVTDEKKTSYKAAIQALRTYLEWKDGQGYSGVFPVDGLDGASMLDFKKGLFMDIAAAVNATRAARPWAFLTAMAERYMFSVIPSFDKDTLMVRPFRPWAAPDAVLPPTGWSIGFPSSEMTAFRGVVQRFRLAQLQASYAHELFTPASTVEESVYINTEYPNGELLELDFPEFISAAVSVYAATVRASAYAQDFSGGDNVTPYGGSAAAGETARVEMESITTVLRELASSTTTKAEYALRFRKDDQCQITGPFVLSDPGGTFIYPGMAVAVVTGAEDAERIRMFITQVTHTLSVSRRVAQTEIVGSHVAFMSEQLPSVVATGRNMYYDA